MANIDLEKKESGGMGWLWGLVALLAVVVIGWWAIEEMGEDDDDVLAEDYAAETDIAANEEFGDETGAYNDAEEMQTAERGANFEEVIGDPERYVGEQITATVRVVEAGSDDGFWIQTEGGDGERMFVIPDPAGNEMPDITSGQTLQLDGAWVRDADELTNGANQLDLDQGTLQALGGQSAYLTVDPANVRVLERGY